MTTPGQQQQQQQIPQQLQQQQQQQQPSINGGGGPVPPQMEVDPFSHDRFVEFYNTSITGEHIPDDTVYGTVAETLSKGYVKPLLEQLKAVQKENAELKKAVSAAGQSGATGTAAYRNSLVKAVVERGHGEISAKIMIDGLLSVVGSEKSSAEEKKQAQAELDSFFERPAKKGNKRWAGSQHPDQDAGGVPTGAPLGNGHDAGAAGIGLSAAASGGHIHPSMVDQRGAGPAPSKRGRWGTTSTAGGGGGILASHQSSMEGGSAFSIGQFSLSDPVENANFQNTRMEHAEKLEAYKRSIIGNRG